MSLLDYTNSHEKGRMDFKSKFQSRLHLVAFNRVLLIELVDVKVHASCN